MPERLETIRMWDGKDYPRSQIERLSPRTVEYAETHEALVESIEFDQRAVWKCEGRRLAWAAAFMAVAFGIGCIAGGDITLGKIVIVAGVLALCVGFTAGITAFAGIPTLRGHFPIIVSLRDGILHIRTPDTYCSAPLSDVSWKFGSPARSRCFIAWHPCREVILLTLPSESKSIFDWLFENPFPVACGLTQPMREHWVTVLKLARVPNRNRKPAAIPQTRTQQ
jgi:hypothetical protein